MSSTASSSANAPSANKAKPWWRFPIVWMVISGPAAVVVAALYTAYLAVVHVDPVLDTSAGKVSTLSQAPALQARNRASQTGAEHARSGSQEPADR
jgi:hypothetical protein